MAHTAFNKLKKLVPDLFDPPPRYSPYPSQWATLGKHGLTVTRPTSSEAGERRTFNETYGTVWDKRALQTGKPSRKNHEDQAVQKARAAAAWLKKENNHKAVMMELGVPEEEISGYSAWGSERHRWKDDGVPMPEEREYD